MKLNAALLVFLHEKTNFIDLTHFPEYGNVIDLWKTWHLAYKM